MNKGKILFFLIILFLSSTVFSLDLVSVTVESKGESLSIKEVQLISGLESINDNTLPYTLALVDKNGNKLSSRNFFISCEILYSVSIGSSQNPPENATGCTKEIRLPFVLGGEKIILIKNSVEVDSFDLATLCNNNNICEQNETEWSCITDCPKGSIDNVCNPKEDGFCDPDCSRSSDRDCYLESTPKVPVISKPDQNEPFIDGNINSKTNEPSLIWMIFPFVLLIGAAFIVLFVFIMNKQKQGERF